MTALRVRKSAVLGVCMLLLWQAPLSADATSPAARFIEPPPWQEQAATVPAYPKDADLLPFPVDQPALSQTFSIDSKSLSVGADDVVRYSAMIASRSGARNVLFEGLRCASREFRTYAYGTAAREFLPAQSDQWRPISPHGWAGFRNVLLRDYLCDSYLSPYPLNEIKRRLSHAQAVR